jgi:hypothetical protein
VAKEEVMNDEIKTEIRKNLNCIFLIRSTAYSSLHTIFTYLIALIEGDISTEFQALSIICLKTKILLLAT